MRFHDGISNIRWKYFTNSKSGLIFKELIGEFRMVEKMTENKRYYIGNGKNCTICDSNQGGSDFYNMLTRFEAVDRLNEQEEEIQTQKDYIIRMGHGTIFEEMKRLKERNQRQYKRLKEITDLMFKRDWKTLELMVDEWEKEEEQLQKYGG